MTRAASHPRRPALQPALLPAEQAARQHQRCALSSHCLSPNASRAAGCPSTMLGWLLLAFVSPWVGSTVLAAAPEKLGDKGPFLEVVSDESNRWAEQAVWPFQL